MARGWESKSVEDQQQAAEERARQKETAPPDDSPAARGRRERLETLRLTRARTLDQLERATNRAHRAMLQRTLRALEIEIEGLAEQ